MSVKNQMPDDHPQHADSAHCAYTHFKASATNLLDSRDPSAPTPYKDLAQAYGLLYSRAKTAATLLLGREHAPCPALEYLKLHASDLAYCIKRDVELTLVDEISAGERGSSDLYGSALYASIVTEDKFQSLQDMIDVSHHALQCTSCIFAFPALASIFMDDDLTDIFGAVLSIIRVPALLTPSEMKTRSIAFCALTILRLPPSVVARKTNALLDLLSLVLADPTTPGRYTDFIGDALKLLHTLLVRYPTSFLQATTALYESVLKLLVSPTLTVRLRAGYALAGYAHAVVFSYSLDTSTSTRESDGFEEIRAGIGRKTSRFIRAQEEERRNHQALAKMGHSISIHTLRKLLQAEIPPSSDVEPGPQVGWAFSVLGCLTVLSSPKVFLEPDYLKLVLNILPSTGCEHPWAPLRALHGFVWRCFVWNFAWTPYIALPKSLPRIDGWRNTKRQQSAHYIRQAPVQGVGASLVCALLGKDDAPFAPELSAQLPRDADVTRSVEVVKGLINSPSRTLLEEGVAVLRRLTNDVGVDTSIAVGQPWRPEALLPVELLDGVLVATELRNIPQLMRNTPAFDMDAIRGLSTSEIESHWEGIFDVWASAIDRVCKDEKCKHLKSELLHVWQALLLVHARLTPSYGHLTSASHHTARILGIVRTFLVIQPDEKSSKKDRYPAKMSLVNDLWVVMKRVFCTLWLAGAAEALLRFMAQEELLERSLHGLDAWREFCKDLIFTADHGTLGSIVADSVDERTKLAIREIWYSFAPLWPPCQPRTTWKGTVPFLVVPMRCWTATDHEMAIWSNLLDRVIEAAAAARDTANAVLENIAEELPDDVAHVVEYLPNLISRTRLDRADIPRNLLSYIDDCLRRYPIEAQDTYPTIIIIDALAQSILTCSASAIIPALKCLQAGLHKWLLAGPTSISDYDYDYHVIPLYRNSLEALRPAATSLGVLRGLDAFLYAPFENIRPGALGASAFKMFWDDVSKRMEVRAEELSPNLKNGLIAWYSVYGGTRPSYLSEDSQLDSQLNTQGTVIPDSQPCEDAIEDEPWHRLRSAPEIVLKAHAQASPLAGSDDRSGHSRREPGSRSMATNPAQARKVAAFATTALHSLFVDDSAELPSLPLGGKRSRSADSASNSHRTIKRARLAMKPVANEPQSMPVGDEETSHGERELVNGSESEATPSVSPRNHTRAPMGSAPRRDIQNQPSREASPALYHSLPSPPLSHGHEAPLGDNRRNAAFEPEPLNETGLGEGLASEHDASIDNDGQYTIIESSQVTEQELRIPSPPPHSAYEQPRSLLAPINALTDLRARSQSQHSGSTPQESPPPQPAGTSLQALRQAREIMLEVLDRDDMTAEDILAAQELLHQMSGILTEKLRKRLFS